MNTLIDALILWWGVTWRYYLMSLLIFIALSIGVLSLTPVGWISNEFNPYEVRIIAIGIFIFILTSIWIYGWSARHLINKAYGSRVVFLSDNNQQHDAKWIDGFTLHWAIHWRVIFLYLITMIALVFFEIDKREAIFTDGSVYTMYGLWGLEAILPFVFGVLSSWHLLRNPYGRRIYSVESRSNSAGL